MQHMTPTQSHHASQENADKIPQAPELGKHAQISSDRIFNSPAHQSNQGYLRIDEGTSAINITIVFSSVFPHRADYMIGDSQFVVLVQRVVLGALMNLYVDPA